MEPSDKLDVPQGTLELMILTILAREPLHGYGVSQKLAALSGDAFRSTPARSFRCSIAWSRTASSRPSGAPATTTARPSSTASPPPAGDSWIATASGGAA